MCRTHTKTCGRFRVSVGPPDPRSVTLDYVGGPITNSLSFSIEEASDIVYLLTTAIRFSDREDARESSS